MIKLKEIISEQDNTISKKEFTKIEKSITRGMDMVYDKGVKNLDFLRSNLPSTENKMLRDFIYDYILLKNRFQKINKHLATKGFLTEQKFNERTTGFTDSGRGYQNKETQIQSVNAVKDASKKVGKLQQNVVGQFIKDIKQGKYDAMDLVRSIKTTPLGDASFSKKEFFLSLFDLIKKRTR